MTAGRGRITPVTRPESRGPRPFRSTAQSSLGGSRARCCTPFTGLYAYDGLGNINGLVVDDAAAFGKTYDPYGTSTVTYDGGGDGLPSNPFNVKAGIDDIATGLVKYGLRWYNPYMGTWTQQDTLDAPLDPANGNRYAYAAGDPINGLDPAGLLTGACKSNTEAAATLGAVAGGATAVSALTGYTIVIPVVGLSLAAVSGTAAGVLEVEALVDCALGL